MDLIGVRFSAGPQKVKLHGYYPCDCVIKVWKRKKKLKILSIAAAMIYI